MGRDTGRLRYTSLLTFLIACALLLTTRLIYLFLADAQRFPISTVKVVANYQHVTREQLENVLAEYMNASFFSLSVHHLQNDLLNLDWTDRVSITRIWPDTLKIALTEKEPVAIWNDSLMTATGKLFNTGKIEPDLNLPRLKGPHHQQEEVLQIYEKLSKLLASYNLQITALELRDNQAWELTLSNGIHIQLGKRDLEGRLQRFCKAYPIVFMDKSDQLSNVDLRYAHGMAVQWKGNSK